MKSRNGTIGIELSTNLKIKVPTKGGSSGELIDIGFS